MACINVVSWHTELENALKLPQTAWELSVVKERRELKYLGNFCHLRNWGFNMDPNYLLKLNTEPTVTMTDYDKNKDSDILQASTNRS